MLDVFPHVRVYQWNPEVLFFLGSDQKMNPEQVMYDSGRPFVDDPFGYLQKSVGSTEDLVAALVMDQENAEGLAVGGQVITDDNNIMATLSARAMESGVPLFNNRLTQLLSDYDPLRQENSEIRTTLGEHLNFTHVSNRLKWIGSTSRATAISNSLLENNDADSFVITGLKQSFDGSVEESRNNLLSALDIDPSNQQARYLLLSSWFDDIAEESAVPEYVSEQLPLLSGTAAATFQARLADHQGDTELVKALDDELSKVSASDMWYETSVKLRSEWRINEPELQPLMASEAMQFIDGAVSFYQSPELYAMRIRAASIIGDVDSVIETTRWLNWTNSNKVQNSLGQYQQMSNDDMQALVKQSDQVIAALDLIEDMPGVDQTKFRNQRSEANRIANRVKSLPEFNPN